MKLHHMLGRVSAIVVFSVVVAAWVGPVAADEERVRPRDSAIRLIDGLEAEHDFSVCREGTWQQAHRAIGAALARGFRVTTNTTLFEGADPKNIEEKSFSIQKHMNESLTKKLLM